MSCKSQTKIFEKMESLYNVGNGLYSAFTTAKRALSFQQKRAFIQEILFSFSKWGTLAQKKGHVFHLWGGGGKCPPMPQVLRPLGAIIRSSDQFDTLTSSLPQQLHYLEPIRWIYSTQWTIPLLTTILNSTSLDKNSIAA
jgi:hypothetical protein